MNHQLSYSPGKTILHNMHPVTKLAWLIVGSLMMFFIEDPYLMIAIAGLFFGLLWMIKPEIFKLRGVKFIGITAMLLLMLYLIFTPSGPILLNLWPGHVTITLAGLEAGLLFSGRFLAIVFLSYCFILTTNPNDLAYALMTLGLSYRFGFMFVTTLRLAPLLEEEGRTIYRAQLVRGVRYDQKNIKRLLIIIQEFLMPLLISALRRVDRLFYSMEGRGFGQHKNRTFRRQTKPTLLDLPAFFLLILFSIIILLIRYGGKT